MCRVIPRLDPSVATILCHGGLVVLKTDTIYGVVACAEHPPAVRKLYAARRRNLQKSCIILVDQMASVPGLTRLQRRRYRRLHDQQPTTLIVAVPDTYMPHLVRTDGTLAFRLVSGELADVIRQTGPLLAPSANPEGLPPATTIAEARAYFGEAVDLYVESGKVTSEPSRIVRFEHDEIITLRG